MPRRRIQTIIILQLAVLLAPGAPFAKWRPQEYAEGPKITMEWKALLSLDEDDWQTMDIFEYTVK